ncbi:MULTISPECIES: hypothetical protein [Burkholderiaceae]|nr:MULTISPECIES: hypothetical protein [Burkholderiaceae]MCG1039343.1 hypothetical protein [Mycetohabitans sp. B7]
MPASSSHRTDARPAAATAVQPPHAGTRHGAPVMPRCWRLHADMPTTLLSGALDSDALAQLSEHFARCFSPVPGPMSLDSAIRNAPTLLNDTAEQRRCVKFPSLR